MQVKAVLRLLQISSIWQLLCDFFFFLLFSTQCFILIQISFNDKNESIGEEVVMKQQGKKDSDLFFLLFFFNVVRGLVAFFSFFF